VFTWSSEEARRHRKSASSKWTVFVRRIRALTVGHRCQRRLRICETLSLGEKRFIAVVEYGQQKFLLAGTQQNISLLQRLDEYSKETERAALPQFDSD
jgi:flagellar biogenesis protein FliO